MGKAGLGPNVDNYQIANNRNLRWIARRKRMKTNKELGAHHALFGLVVFFLGLWALAPVRLGSSGRRKCGLGSSAVTSSEAFIHASVFTGDLCAKINASLGVFVSSGVPSTEVPRASLRCPRTA
jgi:hypothetical protein